MAQHAPGGGNEDGALLVAVAATSSTNSSATPAREAASLRLASTVAHDPLEGPALLRNAVQLSGPSLGSASLAERIKAQLVQVAQAHPEVQSAQAAADSSGFDVEAARRARYPRFKLGTATGTYDNGGPNGSAQSYQLITADLRMSLIDGGAIGARIRAAENQSEAQGEALKSTSQKVVLDAITAYLQVQRFDLKKRIAHRSTEVLDELSRAEQRRVELGVAGQNDLRMAAARRAGTAARESDFEAQRSEALARFESFFRFAPEPTALPALGVPLRWRPTTQAEALALAESRSTELSEARSRVERARALVEQQEASRYPTLDAVLVKSKDPRGVSPSEPTRAALELNWNFGNGFDQQARIKTALAEVSNQEARLEGVRLNLAELTAGAWGRASTGRERERQLLEAVNESGQAFRGRRRLMEFGRETLLNVLDAQVDYYTLLLDYVDAAFDLRIGEFRLARATGRLQVAPDQDNAWLDQIFGGAPLPVLGEEGLLSSTCRAGCGEGARTAASENVDGIALRRAGRLAGS
ncbi:MAG: TolC family protein [Comamonadaceae bacterium]|nr:MAG: TolC family protein [Comamonadaceae bacterium]